VLGPDEIREVLDGTPFYTQSANGHAGTPTANGAFPMCLTPAQWAARALPATDYLLGELFSTTCRAVFCADTGLGKTMIAVALAFALNLGGGFLHWTAKRPARVLFIDGEMPRDLMKERLELACSWFAVEPPAEGLYFLSREDAEDMPPFDTKAGQDWLDTFVDRIGGIDFIIFDNFMSLCVSDLRDEEGWQALKPYVLSLTKRRIGQLWLHHVGHDKSKLYGTKTREWHMDTVMLGEAAVAPGAEVAFKLTFTKARRRKPSNRADFETVQVELREGHWSSSAAEPGGTNKPRALPAAAKIALEELRRCIDHEGEVMPSATNIPRDHRGIRVSKWRDRCYSAGISTGEKEGTRRQAFGRAKEKLIAEKIVGAWEEWAWVR
jgi:hypothetical protein